MCIGANSVRFPMGKVNQRHTQSIPWLLYTETSCLLLAIGALRPSTITRAILKINITMSKVTIKFTGTITLNVEPDEEASDVFFEVDIVHPDPTRVVDFKFNESEVIDSK